MGMPDIGVYLWFVLCTHLYLNHENCGRDGMTDDVSLMNLWACLTCCFRSRVAARN